MEYLEKVGIAVFVSWQDDDSMLQEFFFLPLCSSAADLRGLAEGALAGQMLMKLVDFGCGCSTIAHGSNFKMIRDDHRRAVLCILVEIRAMMLKIALCIVRGHWICRAEDMEKEKETPRYLLNP